MEGVEKNNKKQGAQYEGVCVRERESKTVVKEGGRASQRRSGRPREH